ncbi:MAG: type II toxin-antitoxin system VapC family toxin [Planctomycetaceae bacterium]
MTHLLDTNSCIVYLRRGASSTVAARLAAMTPGSVVLCSVVVAELLYGAQRSAQATKTLAEVRRFCRQFSSLPFDDRAAEEYGIVRAQLAAAGTPIGPNDLMIAAIALANGLTLVTHNTTEFCRVPRLTVEDWQTP